MRREDKVVSYNGKARDPCCCHWSRMFWWNKKFWEKEIFIWVFAFTFFVVKGNDIIIFLYSSGRFVGIVSLYKHISFLWSVSLFEFLVEHPIEVHTYSSLDLESKLIILRIEIRVIKNFLCTFSILETFTKSLDAKIIGEPIFFDIINLSFYS